MTKAEWITIADYSTKFKVSVSTLRRRIKDDAAEFKFEGGKYWLLDLPLKKHQAQAKNKSESPSAPPPAQEVSRPVPMPKTDNHSSLVQDLPLNQGGETSTQVWATAHLLLQEIKKAYMVILQEKEEQIILIKEEVADLKTLVRVLEDNNDRLNGELAETTKVLRVADTAEWAFSLDK